MTSNTKPVYGMTGYDEIHLTHYISMISVVKPDSNPAVVGYSFHKSQDVHDA